LFPHQLAESGDMGAMGNMADMGAMGDMGAMQMDAPAMGWSPATWITVAAMWWVMMIAMMTPSAAPTILLYGAVYRRAQAQGTAARLAPTGAFTLGYLLAWLGF